ncbi:MAG: hypothetical protein ACEQSF_01850 [Solirubrobacteraceae bacterium]
MTSPFIAFFIRFPLAVFLTTTLIISGVLFSSTTFNSSILGIDFF